ARSATGTRGCTPSSDRSRGGASDARLLRGDLVEHAAVGEVHRLRPGPAAEIVDREQLDRGEAGGLVRGVARPVEALRGETLALGRVQELQVGGGDLARAAAVDVAIDDRDR